MTDQTEVHCPECGLGGPVARISLSTNPGSAVGSAPEHLAFRPASLDRIRQCSFPVFGLESWDGRRWFAESGESKGIVDRVVLGYGDTGAPGTPILQVSTNQTTTRSGNLAAGRRMAVHAVSLQLAQHFWQLTYDHTDALRSTFHDPELGQWDELPLEVDGATTTFRALQSASGSVALVTHRDVVIGLRAQAVNLDSIRLIELSDLEPYLADNGLPRTP